MVKVFDPTRAEYNKDRKTRTNCYLCDEDIIKKQDCTKFVFTHWLVLTNKHPYMNGNVMIIPKQHKTAISKLSVDEWQEFPNVLSAVQKELKEMFQTDSFNIGINEGPDSGASIDHLHWQIIPRHRKNHTAVSVLADIQVITLSSDELKKLLSK